MCIVYYSKFYQLYYRNDIYWFDFNFLSSVLNTKLFYIIQW